MFKKKLELRRIRKKPFVYRIDLIQKKIVRKKLKWRFVTLRLVKFYYSLLTYKQFRKLARLAKKKDGLYEQNFILFLEGRLVNFLYRSSLIENVFKSLYYIKGGFVSLNKVVLTYPNEKCQLFDFLSFLPIILYEIILFYVFRLTMRLLLHPPARFIFVSWVFFFCFMYKAPKKQDIPNRKIIDLYRLTGYALLH